MRLPNYFSNIACTVLGGLLCLSPVDAQETVGSAQSEQPIENAGVRAGESSGIELGSTVFEFAGESFQLESARHQDESGVTSVVASSTGDLNSDGRDDLVIAFKLQTASSGELHFLNVLLADEQSKWMFAGEEFLGNRILIKFLDIYKAGSFSRLTGTPIDPDDYGKLVIGMYTLEEGQNEDDGIFFTRHWQIEDEKLVVVEDY
jgi:hypothetical protein